MMFTCKRLALLVFVGGFSRVRHMFGWSRWAGFRKAELQVAYKAVEHRRRQQRESINRDPLIRGLIIKINKNRVGLEVIWAYSAILDYIWRTFKYSRDFSVALKNKRCYRRFWMFNWMQGSKLFLLLMSWRERKIIKIEVCLVQLSFYFLTNLRLDFSQVLNKLRQLRKWDKEHVIDRATDVTHIGPNLSFSCK